MATPATTTTELLRDVLELTRAFEASLPERHVGARADGEALRRALARPLPDAGEDPRQVIAAMARGADAGVIANAGPRYFGFVIGGRSPAALAADWLVSVWDQNAGLYVCSPAASVLEDVAAGWCRELLGLPPDAAVGFVTGTQAANITGLAAARTHLLAAAGWDVEVQGLRGSPRLHVVVGEEVHVTVLRAAQWLGLGTAELVRVPADAQGALRPDALADALARLDGPTVVCAQAGNVNTGAVDPLGAVADACAARPGTWLHVDGAFGLWAAASPRLRHLTAGLERANSWATDAHKWLNVPYDSALVAVRPEAALRKALGYDAAYLVPGAGERDGKESAPEFSRRARGIPVYAALAALGRRGVAELVERCCAHARLFAELLHGQPGVEVLNAVVLNQVLVRFSPPGGGDADAYTREVIARVQAEGTCWMGGTVWHGQAAMRISVSGAATQEADVRRSAEAVLRCARAR